MTYRSKRPDRQIGHRGAFERNKKKILKTRSTCEICGNEIDMSLKFPNPLSPSIDHKIAVGVGGHPSAIENLQLAHLGCNMAKGKKRNLTKGEATQIIIGNRILPQSQDWRRYKADDPKHNEMNQKKHNQILEMGYSILPDNRVVKLNKKGVIVKVIGTTDDFK